MLPTSCIVDLAIHVEGTRARSTTSLTTIGPGAFFVVLDTTAPDALAFRLTSTYLGTPGTGSMAMHQMSGGGIRSHALRRAFETPPTDSTQCILDHVAQIQARLEEWLVDAEVRLE